MVLSRAQRRRQTDVLLPSLPTEILDLIFSLCKQSTLRDLTETCKDFRSVARPRVFKTIVLRTISQLRDIINTDDEILGMISTLELAFDWDEEFQDEPWAGMAPALVAVLPRLTDLQELILDDRVCRFSEDPVVAPFYTRRPPFDPISPRRRSPTSTPYAYLTLEILLAIFNHPRLKTFRHSQLAYSDLNLSPEAFEDFEGPPPTPTFLPFFAYPDDDARTPSTPTFRLLLSLLSNFAIQPKHIEVPVIRSNLEPAKSLIETTIPGLETVKLDFDFDGEDPLPGETDDFDLSAFFKSLGSQHPSLRNIILFRVGDRRERILRALAAIPGFEGFANERFSAVLNLLPYRALSVGFSGAGEDGRRVVLRLGSQDEDDHYAWTREDKSMSNLLECFPTLEVLDSRGTKRLFSNPTTLHPLFKVPSFSFKPIFPSPSIGLKTLILPLLEEYLAPDFEGIDLRAYCRHHSHLVPPLSADDLKAHPAELSDVVSAFESAGGPARRWREQGFCDTVDPIYSLAEAFPSLEIIAQPMHFGLKEYVTLVFIISRTTDDRINIVLGEENRWGATPMDRGYACACDLEKFSAETEDEYGPLYGRSVRDWWVGTE